MVHNGSKRIIKGTLVTNAVLSFFFSPSYFLTFVVDFMTLLICLLSAMFLTYKSCSSVCQVYRKQQKRNVWLTHTV